MGHVQKGEKRTAEEAELDAPEEMAHTGSEEGGGVSTTPYQPIPLQRHLGNRKSHKTRFVYSGTTFVGSSYNGQDNDNTWFRFPWEFTQAALRSWETYNQAERYLMWRAHNISVEFKNPICITDSNTGGDGQVAAGENLYAQLFAYADNLYMTGIKNTWNTGDGVTRGEVLAETDIEALLKSWGNHGYSEGGVPVELPSCNISRNSFQHNFPDVKQSGMGGGNRIAFKWNMSSPYWRFTMELYNQATGDCNATADDFVATNFSRWDEQFGRIGMYADDVYEYADPLPDCQPYGTVQPEAYVRALDRSLRDPNALTQGNSFWTRIADPNTAADGTFNAGKGFNVFYRDSEPIPSLWLQVQPQLQGIDLGLTSTVAQVQFEVHIDIELMGQCPSVLNASPIVGSAEPANAQYARRWINNFAWKIPMFYPIVQSDDYTEEGNE